MSTETCNKRALIAAAAEEMDSEFTALRDAFPDRLIPPAFWAEVENRFLSRCELIGVHNLEGMTCTHN